MGINNKIAITQLSPKMQELLNQYAGNVTKKIKVLAEETVIELTKNTKTTSPEKTGDYKRHISYEKTRETSTSTIYTWHVKDPEYRLTHLLVNGHAKRNGGRVGSKFPLAEQVIEAENKFVNGVKEIIENEHWKLV